MPTVRSNETRSTGPTYGMRQDIDQIIELVQRSGSHFFDKSTMRFFRSRVAPDVYVGATGWYFITSEQDRGLGANYPRLYTVRFLKLENYDGKPGIGLYELEGFQHFSSLGRARTAARYAAKTNPPICVRCSLRLVTVSVVVPQTLCEECRERETRDAERAEKASA